MMVLIVIKSSTICCHAYVFWKWKLKQEEQQRSQSRNNSNNNNNRIGTVDPQARRRQQDKLF
jgi:hypothetical protein